ncbi:MAG: Fe-S cluster assembly protein SufD [Bacteroidaceae bacterium]|nr:Fe-S cluster assembly protein SufD [Bacteroidaceae bacterium]
MQALQQYIDLYREHHEVIDRHSTAVLNALRPAALQEIERNGLPTTRHEDYHHTNLEEIFAPDYGLNITRIELPSQPHEAFRCDVPNLSTQLYFLVGDNFYRNDRNRELPDGVLAGSLRDIAESHPELVARYYGKVADMSKDGTVALNTLLAQDGFFLYIPRHVVLERPIQLVNIISGGVSMMHNRRILVVAEEGAQAKLLVCDHSEDDGINQVITQVTEIYAGEGAVVDYYNLEENASCVQRVSSTFVHQAATSNVLVNGITLRNGATRDNYYIALDGEGCETQLCGMAIADGEKKVDVYSHIDHRAAHCTSNELFKFVLDENAIGSFAGRILVREGSQKTEAYQSNKNLCASSTAHMYTKPQLEIYADDVKCSHGATVGQLDQQALFYMRTRGISEAEARMLLQFAFMSDVIENVRLEALKDRLRQLVEKRFRGELSQCQQCAMRTQKQQ